MRKLYFIALFLILNLFLISYSQEKGVPNIISVTAEGEGVTEEAALNQAKRMAIEQGVGVFVLSETLVNMSQVRKDEIYSKSLGFISKWDVLEKKQKNGIYYVKIKAIVGSEPLTNYLKELGVLKKWSIAVVFTSNGVQQKALEAARNSVNEVIKDAGFTVADQEIIAQLDNPKVMVFLSKENYLSVIQILRNKGIDLLITGKAFAELTIPPQQTTYGDGIPVTIPGTANGRIDAKVVKIDTGEIIAVKSFTGKGGGTAKDIAESDALDKVGKLVGEHFVKEIIKLPASSTMRVQLIVKGLTFKREKIFREILSQEKQVLRLYKKSYLNNTVTYEIEIEGDTSVFADILSESKKLKSFKFEIESVTSGQIKVKLK